MVDSSIQGYWNTNSTLLSDNLKLNIVLTLGK